MSERPNVNLAGEPIEWFGEIGLAFDGDEIKGSFWINGELWAAPTIGVLWALPSVYAALRAERQARAAVETQATYWQREQAAADAKWKELQTALDTERQARQAAEARAARLESWIRDDYGYRETCHCSGCRKVRAALEPSP